MLSFSETQVLMLHFKGFSYSEEGEGSLNPITGSFEPADFAGVQGRYPVINATMIGKLQITRT